MKFRLFLFSLLCLTSCFSSLNAYDATPRCFREIERTFFEPSVVALALEYYEVPQSSWNLIANGLKSQNSRIPKKMREYARKMKPNPLSYPFDDQGAIRLLRQVSREIFMDATRKYHYNRKFKWERIFSYIFDSELERIERCFEY